MTTQAPQHPTQHRLPTEAPAGRGARERVLAVLTVVGTLAVVVAVPIALFAAFGPPWPSETPTMQWLSQPSTTEAVLAVFAVVVWLAWAHFVLCLAVEVVAAIRRRGISPQVPGGGLGSQALARHIVVTATVLLGVTAATVGPASAVSAADPGNAPTVTASSQVAAGEAAAPVQKSMASTEVVAKGAVPGRSTLKPATQADMKGDATTYYEVNPPRDRHYDTLWDISERYLGDGRRYKEIVELNQGLTQPDGTELRNPDLIYPGWVLKLPSDAAGPGLRVVEHVDPAVPESGGQA
ncbi:MAG: LysM peptidoglycan-binding domain-containing protein, partial [Nocardioides sp.]|nr:LysM peptidoglycan-binding domain-containing protein [Nocardioides sp.]